MPQAMHVRLGGLAVLLVLPLPVYSQDCPTPHAGITVQIPAATIQGTKGSTVLHLQNPQASAVALNLKAGPFVSQTTGSVVPGAKADLSPANGSEPKATELGPGKSIDILATINDESAVGVSEARVFNADTCVALLQAVRYDAPLNLTVEEVGTAASPLQVQKGRDIVISLKNSDDLAYPVSPFLYLEDKETKSNAVTIGPNSSAQLRFSPPKEWFDARSWFRARSANLHLVLLLTPS